MIHRFGGLLLESDRPLPGLPLAPPGEPVLARGPDAVPAREPALFLEHGPVALPPGSAAVHAWPGELGMALFRVGEGWCFRSREDHAFAVDAQGTRVCCAPHPTGHEMLLRQVLPRVLHLRGRFVLHGSAVETPGGALAILGPSGAGKSTLAAFLRLHLGWPILADDALVLELGEGAPILHPTGPRTRLWQDSAAFLGEGVATSQGLPRRPGKLDCDLRSPAAWEGRLLHRVLVLDLESGALSSAEAVVRLLQHQVRFHPGDPQGPPRQMALAARLASQVRVQRFRLPRDLARLPEAARELAA